MNTLPMSKLVEDIEKECRPIKTQYRIVINGKWVGGATSIIFGSIKAARTSLNIKLIRIISNRLCQETLGRHIYSLNFNDKYTREQFRQEAKKIIEQLFKDGTIRIEEVK